MEDNDLLRELRVISSHLEALLMFLVPPDGRVDSRYREPMEMVEIIGPSGKVHYRREIPALVAQVLREGRGYWVRPAGV